MNKILIVARTEFANAVRSKAFLVSLLILPLLYGLMIIVQVVANRADIEPRHFAVLDRTGVLYPAIKAAAEARNKTLVKPDGTPSAPLFFPSEVKEDARSLSQTTLALSDQVRSKKLYAFAEIPRDAVEAKGTGPITVNYYSNNPNYRDLRGWLEVIVASAARSYRYQSAGIDPELSARIDRPVVAENLGLVSRVSTTGGGAGTQDGGTIVEARKIDLVRSLIVPLVLAMIAYMISMTVSPQLVGTILEEKMSRISEMLISSISPFELMMGKLLGNISQGMLTAGLYIAAGYFAASRYGYADMLPPSLIAILLLFVTMSILLFGSLFMAVGSACSELKDAQTLVQPVMILAILPAFLLGPVLTNPAGPISVVASLFPPATPMLMTMRMAMSPAPPVWQVGLAIALMTASALVCVWASAKIFRTGLLMHGKAPNFRELARWVVAK